MSDVSQGLGWWQASDLKWYPPERHPDYVAPPPPPPTDDVTEADWQAAGAPEGPPPQARPAPSPDTQTVVVQMPAVSLATVKDTVAKLSVTAWLLFGGFVIAAIGIFFPWQTVSFNAAGLGELGSNNSALAGGARFAVLLVIAAAVWLAWPARSGSKMSVRRLTGLTVVVCLLVGVFVLGFYGVSAQQHESMPEVGRASRQGSGCWCTQRRSLPSLSAPSGSGCIDQEPRNWPHRSAHDHSIPSQAVDANLGSVAGVRRTGTGASRSTPGTGRNGGDHPTAP